MSVLTVITRKTGAVPLARLGYRVARALESRLVVLCLDSGSGGADPVSFVPGDDLPEGTDATVAEICRQLARGDHAKELGEAAEEPRGRALPDPQVEVRWLETPRRLAAVLEQISACDAGYLIAGKHRARSKEVTLARKLFTAAPCHTLLVRVGESGNVRCEHILVPTAGGPHASTALRLGERLASAEGGEVVALYVGSDSAELAEEVGGRILDQAIEEAGVAGGSHVERRVVLSPDRVEAIQKVAHEGFDLLLLGDSNAGSIRRRLFGSVPDYLLAGKRGLAVAVMRREWKLLHRLRRRLGQWLDVTIPQMARAERVALYEKLQSGSVWNFDFMALICLSTAIAALGLLQDSGAVVIGAMLVAPLMTPILGAGLALVQGNFPLLRTAIRSIGLGYFLALLIGLGLGLLFPIPELTPQLEARGGPTLLDLGVALLSGVAAAFCLGRPGLLGALPGVAIAAALVPPIATTGVCLALGEDHNAQGAALLFGTNVVAIVLGAAISLYASGVRGKRGASGHQVWVRYSFLVLLVGTAALAVPLSTGLLSYLSGGAAVEIPAVLEPRLRGALAARPEVRLERVSLRPEGNRQILMIELGSPRPVAEDLLAELAAVARETTAAGQRVRIATRLVADFE